MEYLDKYIPKEYLALKINYCKKRLQELPEVRLHECTVNGIRKTRLTVGDHRYNLNSENGQSYHSVMLLRDELEKQLAIYEAIWNRYFRMPPPEYKIPQIKRTINTGNNQLILDKNYFDSLKNDANTKYPKPVYYPFNGIYYRSAAERKIAAFYTDMDIPFKYEPEVYITGLPKPINPDFVFYIKELNTCKFHDHFGMMNYADYLRDIKIKCGNYSNAGLQIDQDVFFTYNSEDKPFDIRYMAAKINTVIYGTMVCGI